jgi:hypothetical protein
MRESLREAVRVRYDQRCAYCGVSETNIGAKMTIDHFQPRVEGGHDSFDNLLYCCHACNDFKREYWHTDLNLRLLHPPFDDWTQHYKEQDDGTVLTLTERGANHIKVLRLNRPQLIAFRLEQQDIAAIRAHCRHLENLMAQLRQEETNNNNRIGRVFGDPNV